MEQDPSNNPSFSQWKELKPLTTSHIPQEKHFTKCLISLDHLIALAAPNEQQQDVFTFHLKDLFWSNHIIQGSSYQECMTSKSSLARPGLIVDYSEFSSSFTFRLLSFETEEEPKNFCLTTKDLKSSILAQLKYFSFNAHQTGIYLFGGERKTSSRESTMGRSVDKYAKSNTVYRVDLESLHVSELFTGEKKPCERSGHRTSLWKDQLFIFGGRSQNDTALSDLWVLNLSEMRWNQLENKDLMPVLKSPHCILAHDNQIFLSDYYNKSSSILSYSFDERSWEIVSPSSATPKDNASEFLIHQDSIILILFNSKDYFSSLHSFPIKNKMIKSKGKQLENFMVKLWEQKANSDVTFHVENEEIPANKCVLTLRCPFFKNAFSSDMMESHNSIIPIKDVKAKVFKAMLRYIYFADIGLTSEIAEDLFKLAHEYRLEELKDECEEFLMKDIQVENVIKRVHFAQIYEVGKLRKASLVFIAKNVDEVFRTQNIHELDKETLLELYKIKI